LTTVAATIAGRRRYRGQDLQHEIARLLDWLVTTEERLAATTVLGFLGPCAGCFISGGFPRIWSDIQSTCALTLLVGGGLLWWRKYPGIKPPREARRDDQAG
jgi:hypothetical protein